MNDRPSFVLLEPERAGDLFLFPAAGALVIGDSHLKDRFTLDALAYFAATSPVAEAYFWGRRAAHYRDMFDDRIATLRVDRTPPETTVTRAAVKFDLVDFLLEAERVATSARPAPTQNIALLHRGDILESRMIAALDSHADVAPPPDR